MIWAAALFSLAADPVGAAELRAIGSSGDVRAVPYLERAIETRLDEIASFPSRLAPPDVEDEIVAGLLALERLDRERAEFWAGETLSSARGDESRWTAREIAARAGDIAIVRTGLREYFRAPDAWSRVLGSAARSGDVRLSEYAELAPPAEQTVPRLNDEIFRTRLLRALGESLAPDHGVSWEGLLGLDPLEIQAWVLALEDSERYLATRFLASSDHPALVGLPMTAETIDRLYPYLARSRHRELRDRVHRARSARGEALASLLVSDHLDAAEKRDHAEAMRDAWSECIVVIQDDVLTPVVGAPAIVDFIADSEPSEALTYIDGPEARVRLESAATASAMGWLGERSDRALSMPALTALRSGSGEALTVARSAPDGATAIAAEKVLLGLGAPGSTTFLRTELTGERLPELVPVAVEAPIDPALIQQSIENLGRLSGHGPAAVAAVSRFHELYPRAFLDWLDRDDETLLERARFVMALSGNPARLPLLIELAVAGEGASRRAAFLGLSEMDLGSFGSRLHRLAGDPDRNVRFDAAVALVPTGEPWALRLLVAELDPSDSFERRRARKTIERLPANEARAALASIVSDGTANAFAMGLFMDLEENLVPWRDRLWQMLEPNVAVGDKDALLAAARLASIHPEAKAAVARFLDAR